VSLYKDCHVPGAVLNDSVVLVGGRPTAQLKVLFVGEADVVVSMILNMYYHLKIPV